MPHTVVSAITEILKIEHERIVAYAANEKIRHQQYIDQFIMPLTIDENLQQNFVYLLEKSVVFGRAPNFLDQASHTSLSSLMEKLPARESVVATKKAPTIQNEKFTSRSDIIDINAPDSFNKECESKTLHYFERQSRTLHLLNLEQSGADFTSFTLDISFSIPAHHQSLQMPNGSIYLIGGEIPHTTTCSTKIYRYNPECQTLDYMANMLEGRSKMALCHYDGLIYIVGGNCCFYIGMTTNGMATSKCEIFDTATREINRISSCSEDVYSTSICAYGSEIIYRFGGVLDNQQLSQRIEKYNRGMDKWFVVEPVVSSGIEDVKLLSNTVAIQINNEEIIVMGGKQ
jgi:hypothetical protein